MYTVPDRSAATLLPIIAQSILPGSAVMSDLWAAHGGIGALGFQHLTVNHSINFVGPVTGAHTKFRISLEECQAEEQKATWNTSHND